MWNGLRLAVAALLTLVLIEAALRSWRYPDNSWYAAANRQVAAQGAKILFIGTSRVAVIPTEAFQQELDRLTNAQHHVINVGQGFSTLAEHYLGLRFLVEHYPDEMRRTVVFVEAPNGCADPSTWQDPWFSTEQPQLLVSVMRLSDVPALFRTRMELEDRLTLATRYAMRWSVLSTFRERVRVGAFEHGAAAISRAIPAGLRLDSGAVWEANNLKRIRAAARDSPWRLPNSIAWDETVAASIVALLRANGSRAVFFDVPLSRVQTSTEDGSQRSCSSFAQAAGRWSSPLLETGAAYADDAYPDDWHLAPAYGADYARRLARAWADTR